MYHVGEEVVRGIIIGEMTWPYEFWTEPGKRTSDPLPHLIAKRHFENDREAVAWFKEHYPAEYKQGAEMRCFDQQEQPLDNQPGRGIMELPSHRPQSKET